MKCFEHSNVELAVITPSYINSSQRVDFASKSLKSLQNAIGTRYRHIIVDDTPRISLVIPPRVRNWLPILKWHEKAKTIYNDSHVTLIRRFGSGSASAILRALREAKGQGANLVFIHLDDHVYISLLDKLIHHALDAFNHDSELSMVRFSGYPLIYNDYVKFAYKQDKILFDEVILKPHCTIDYTLWWSYYHENAVNGRYWPIPLWFCIYRVDFLENILSHDTVKTLKHLAHVELYYKSRDNWRNFIAKFPGKFGYINMQYGGIEMHRNKNWQDLLKIQNDPIR